MTMLNSQRVTPSKTEQVQFTTLKSYFNGLDHIGPLDLVFLAAANFSEGRLNGIFRETRMTRLPPSSMVKSPAVVDQLPG